MSAFCVIQRVAYWLLGFTDLLAFIHNPGKIGHQLYSALMIIFSLVGAIVAIRQSWLIRYPESFECGISPKEAFMNSLPIAQFKTNSIGQKFTGVRRPQTHGKAKRVIKTILEMWHQQTVFTSRNDRELSLARFVNFYNTMKPHYWNW